MDRLWRRVCDVVRQAYALLQENSAHLIGYLCEEERARWQRPVSMRAEAASDFLYMPDVHSLPTLTLSTEFPLPPGRQPGRLRRLRNNRARGRPSQFLRGRALDG